MNAALNKIQFSIMKKVEKQVQKKLAMKRSYKKKIKTAIERSSRRLFYRILNDSKVKVKCYRKNSKFGYDELGRDVEDGLRQYIKVLKSRKLQIHTVIVLGSRVKGGWEPSSDVDITIIAGNLHNEGRNLFTKRLFSLKRKFVLSDRSLYMGIEPSGCCSKTEFLARLEQFDIQALDAIHYGYVIYDDGFWGTVKIKYKEIEKKYGLEKIPLKKMLAAV